MTDLSPFFDWLADRILANDRNDSKVTGHKALRETGILSRDQMDRRLEREVYSSWGVLAELSDEEFKRGVFGRAHLSMFPNTWVWPEHQMSHEQDPVAYLMEDALVPDGREYPSNFWYVKK